jgi:uncharacterized membrane protein YcfT
VADRLAEYGGARQAWVDHARGISIILIVVLHARFALAAVPDAEFFDALIRIVQPFRLPALFLLSGLFLARIIDRAWPQFLDRRVIHYAYFYAVWATIEFAPVFATGLARDSSAAAPLAIDYLWLFVSPHGPLWFIYALPLFFVLAKVLRKVPAWIVLPVAAVISIADVQTGWVISDRLASRYVYFHAGYALAPAIFAAGAWMQANARSGALMLVLWLTAHLIATLTAAPANPLLTFALGVAGCAAVLAAGALLSRSTWMGWLALFGRRSLAIFLAFPLLLVAARKALELAGWPLDGDLRMLIVVAGAIFGALLIHRLTRGTLLGFLFERPRWAQLAERPQANAAAGSTPRVEAQPRVLD